MSAHYSEIIADVLAKHLPMKRFNPRHPAVMACAREIETAVADAMLRKARA